MPGAGYIVTCTACELPNNAFGKPTDVAEPDWPAMLDEFFGERGGHECRYCPECGHIGLLRHFFKLVCEDCGGKGNRRVEMFEPADRCECGGVRTVQLSHGRAPKCRDHPAVELREMSLIELQEIDDGMTTVPCRACGEGVLVIGQTTVLMD